MAKNTPVSMVPTNIWRLPIIASDLWEDLGDLMPMNGTLNGLSISEDDKNVYVQAAVPGIDPENIDVTFEKGILWIKGDSKEEIKNRKYYRKASSNFSYRITVPGDVEWNSVPVAATKNGMMTVTFTKTLKKTQNKIKVKAE
jgi:HSP20 family protein